MAALDTKKVVRAKPPNTIRATFGLLVKSMPIARANPTNPPEIAVTQGMAQSCQEWRRTKARMWELGVTLAKTFNTVETPKEDADAKKADTKDPM